VGFSLGMFPPALIAHVYQSRSSLGRFSGFGALGWSIGTFTAGIIGLYWGVFVFSSSCIFLAFLLSFWLPDVEKVKLRVPLFPKELLRKNWQVYLPFFLRHSGANCIWIIYPLYIASLGGDKFWIGVIYTVNTATQFVVMQFVDRFEGKTLLKLGLAFSSITFVAISLAQSFLHLIPVQVMLGSSWSCLYVGSLVYLMKHNVEKSTSGGMLGSLISLAMVLGSLIGGGLSSLFGFRATMYVAAALTILGFLLFTLSNRKVV
jgi:predicted MFS family arabinose efflux permease